MSLSTELRVNRKNTAAFIADAPTTATLKPQRRVRTASGGFDVAVDPPRPPQTFRIIDTTNRAIVRLPPQRTIDGIERSVECMIVGNWDMVAEKFDTWTDADGLRWEITEVFPDNGYERRYTVVKYGD